MTFGVGKKLERTEKRLKKQREGAREHMRFGEGPFTEVTIYFDLVAIKPFTLGNPWGLLQKFYVNKIKVEKSFFGSKIKEFFVFVFVLVNVK